jgi:hypothetical protein
MLVKMHHPDVVYSGLEVPVVREVFSDQRSQLSGKVLQEEERKNSVLPQPWG